MTKILHIPTGNTFEVPTYLHFSWLFKKYDHDRDLRIFWNDGDNIIKQFYLCRRYLRILYEAQIFPEEMNATYVDAYKYLHNNMYLIEFEVLDD